MLNRLLRIAAFQNPEFYKAQAMRLSTFDKPRVIACAEDLPRHLTGRTDHLSQLESALVGKIRNVIVLKGGMVRKQRRAVSEVLAGVPEGDQRLILATGSYIGEGLDDARLDTLFLAMPISWRGTLQQYVGRLHRLHDSKSGVEVYDYVDANVRMLARMFDRRLKGYEDIGYKVLSTVQPRLNM